ncbi:ADP-dependent glucokinase/phosphofructokinase [Natrialbaceae archaeon A-CW3]
MESNPYDRDRLELDFEALDGLPVFVAYNVNIDAIVQVDEALEGFLDPPEEPGTLPVPSLLRSKRDLSTAITHTMAAGRGDEIAMIDDFAATLDSELTPDVQQMGGQAGIMTNLLTSLGTAPITYTPLVSDRQLELFDHPNSVRYPLVENGTVSYISLDEAVNTDRTKINWVFEFGAGDELFGVEAREDTRFIAASKPPGFDLLTGALDTAIDQVGDDVDGALLAGYHNLSPEHNDGYKELQYHAREVIRGIKSNGDLPVHVEYAVTHDDNLRDNIYEWILPEANVIGVDTHELGLLYVDAGLDAKVEVPSEATPFDPEEILAHYRMLSAIRDELGVNCIQLHAMEYHVAVIDSHHSPKAVLRGLEFSAVNAATKAARGDITSPEDLGTGLEYEPSKRGRKAIELLAEFVGTSADDGRLATPFVVACPNRVVQDPAGTVGIGDIVSSSSFILELAHATSDGVDS